MVTRQRWTIPKEEPDIAELLDRAAKLCCYVLATKLIFYEALRARFEALKPINVSPSVDSPDRLYGLLSKHFENAQHVTHDYETIFWPDFGAKVPMCQGRRKTLPAGRRKIRPLPKGWRGSVWV
jgi:hypothetical protein